MNYIEEEKSNEERSSDNSWWQEHWEKYKVYYLFFGALPLILISFFGINRRLSRIERFFLNNDEIINNKKSSHLNYLDREFKFPDPQEQDEKKWLDKIYQKEVRDRIEENYINQNYISDYQTTEAPKESRNIIFFGPPGTGKTYYSNLLAQNESCCYVEFSGGQPQQIWVASAKETWVDLLTQVRKKLPKAKKKNPTKPAMIIINEIDAMLHKEKGINGERIDNSMVTTFLQNVEDIITNNEDIVIIGTTNDLKLIDEAAIRQGRFGVQIEIPKPKTETERGELIKYLQKEVMNYYKTATNRELWKNKDENKIVEFSADFWEKIRHHNEEVINDYNNINFSFADFRAAVNKAVLGKVRKDSQKISLNDDDYRKKIEEIAKTKIN